MSAYTFYMTSLHWYFDSAYTIWGLIAILMAFLLIYILMKPLRNNIRLVAIVLEVIF